uniref:non-specific serine/threonine protein kinase n=1 Tax=Brassica oleracea var. oleracea TaxID=109376 RepID=A0A0D3B238_BRAOL
MKLSLSLALILLVVFTVVFAQARISNETDMKALLEFKSQAAVNRREVLASWNNSSPVCTWIGVTCNRRRERVTSLNLGGFKLAGVISPSIGNLSFLISLNLGDNSFVGTIPQEVGMLFRLQYLNMSFNLLEGKIPHSLSNCYRLSTLDLSSNRLEHNVPSELGSLSKLVIMHLNNNKLTGEFPASLGNLTSLQELDFAYNNMEGEIPFDVARLTQMVFFQVSQNRFSGVFPPALYNMSLLESLSLAGNSFSGELRADFGDLLPNLRTVVMGGNEFTGAVPITLANISSLGRFDISTNYLTGSIPLCFGKLHNLWWLGINTNSLGNNSPSHLEFIGALANCTQLEYLDVGYNRLGSELPASIANLSTKCWICIQTQYQMIHLYENSFQGSIPQSIGRCQNLMDLWIDSNRLNGTIPLEILQIPSLAYLDLSNNFLTCSLPEEVGKLQLLVGLAASNNKLSGHLPHTLGGCLSLEFLYMQGNSFDGDIPDISQLVSLRNLDFSNNNLSGSIPPYLATFHLLRNLNLSVNKFEGSVPVEGVFRNATADSVFGNLNLCGGIREMQLQPCTVQASPKPRKHLSLEKKVAIGMVSVQKKNNASGGNPSDSSTLGMFFEKISFEELRDATSGFSSSNLIGPGNFGDVFKGFLGSDHKLVAVKPEDLESVNDHSRILTPPDKLNIAIDVASALEYLHVECHDPVAHCDLKPSNVLLDDDLTAHVGDFGLARFLYKYDRETFLNNFSSAGVRGTIGYAAPEYGMGGQPSIQGDVYSFGVLVLEMFIGKKPTDVTFAGDYNLHSYAKSLLSGDEEEGGGSNAIDEWLRLVLQVGIRCSEEYPSDRVRITEALRELTSIRTKFFTSKTTITEPSHRDAVQSSPQEWMLNADIHTIQTPI